MPGIARCCAAFLLALAALLLIASPARAADTQCPGGGPTIHDKPDAIGHVAYPGMTQDMTYCYGPVRSSRGRTSSGSTRRTSSRMSPGYITRFDPELVYTNGTVPRVDVLHLHHAVWVVNGTPQFAVGEEKTILQLPQGFGWPSHPADCWFVNDMLHDLVAQPARSTSSGESTSSPRHRQRRRRTGHAHRANTRWMDVAGDPERIYPVFDALRSRWARTAATPSPTRLRRQTWARARWPGDQRIRTAVGTAQTWTAPHPETLIGTAGHLHPGGLDTQLKVSAAGARRTRSSPPTPTTTSLPARSPGTSRWGRRRATGRCSSTPATSSASTPPTTRAAPTGTR